jgi:Ca2+-binding RTX toxin-like protein
VRVVATTTDVLGGTTAFEGNPLAVVNINNPVEDLALTASSITENAAVGTGIRVGNLIVTDPDAAGNNNTLSIGGADAASFALRNGNELFYVSSASPDFETKSLYSITITASDTSGAIALSYAETFSIAVVNVNEPPSGTLGISGNAVIGQTLTALNTINDPDGIASPVYQWFADGVAISGATASNLTLQSGQLGKAISVQFSYSDPFGSASFFSAATGQVAEPVIRINMITTSYTGTNGQEWVIGTSGNDTISTLGGNDTLDGGLGIDKLFGGAGDDVYLVDLNSSGAMQDSVTEEVTSGLDTVLLRGTAKNTKASTITAPANVEVLDASGTASTLLNLTGNALSNRIVGNDAANVINAGKGADEISGGLGRDTFVFAPGDSGQVVGFDRLLDYAKGSNSVGDLIDYSASLTVGGSASAATQTQASINQSTGVATFAAGSGLSLSDCLADICTRMTSARDSAGEFALFRIGDQGNYYLFISDGVAGLTANDVLVELVGVTSVSSINLSSGNLTITG